MLERGVIAETSKLNGKCGTADRKKRKAAKQAVGIGKGESIDVPVHVGWADQVPCCLEFLLSEQADFKEQQNAIQELVLSRGHFCIFLPKFHPELNFIERYWSRVKWYARQFSDGTIKGLKAQADVAMTMSDVFRDLRPRAHAALLPHGVALGRLVPLRARRRLGELRGAQVEVPSVSH